VNSINEPKGIVYLDIPTEYNSVENIAKAMQKALGWSPDQIIDSEESKYNNSSEYYLRLIDSQRHL
jgi:hypothetical protein